MLVAKGLMASVASAEQTFARWAKGQDTIRMSVLKELKSIFGITYDTIIDNDFFNDNND